MYQGELTKISRDNSISFPLEIPTFDALLHGRKKEIIERFHSKNKAWWYQNESPTAFPLFTGISRSGGCKNSVIDLMILGFVAGHTGGWYLYQWKRPQQESALKLKDGNNFDTKIMIIVAYCSTWRVFTSSASEASEQQSFPVFSFWRSLVNLAIDC